MCAAAAGENGVRIVLGARPARAVVVYEGTADAADFDAIAASTVLGGNLRASQAYRRKVAPVLMARAAARAAELYKKQEGKADEY